MVADAEIECGGSWSLYTKRTLCRKVGEAVYMGVAHDSSGQPVVPDLKQSILKEQLWLPLPQSSMLPNISTART